MDILSIDPGVNNCGICIASVSDTFTVKETTTVINNKKFSPEDKDVEKVYGPRTVKILTIVNKINELIDQYNVDHVIIEAPFYSALKPNAYGPLLEVISAIKYMIVLPRQLKFAVIEPLYIKKQFTDQSQASKEIMRNFLKKKQLSGNIIYDKNIDELTEHEVDSIAVGFVFALQNNQTTV